MRHFTDASITFTTDHLVRRSFDVTSHGLGSRHKVLAVVPCLPASISSLV